MTAAFVTSSPFLAISLSIGILLLFLIIYLIIYYKKFIKQEGYIGTNGPSTSNSNSNSNSNSSNVPAYVICLSDKVYQQALKNINIPNLQKFDAVKGSTLDINKVDVTIRAKRDILLDSVRETHADLGTLNGIGCYLSHITLWAKVVDENLKGMYIFESDAVCTNNFNEYLDLFLQEDNPHALFFGIIGRPTGLTDKISKIPGRFYGLHAYYITYEGAKLMLQFARPIEQQLDSYLSDINLLSNDPQNKLNMEPLNLYVVNDYQCNQKNTEGTSIQIKRVRGG